MTVGVQCVGEYETLLAAAIRMRQQNVGALPICAEDGHMIGVLTDRDIVVKCLAAGEDPRAAHSGQYADNAPISIDVGASVEDVLDTMIEHRIRRIPVLDDGTLVGMISQSDLAAALPEDQVGHLVEAISAAP